MASAMYHLTAKQTVGSKLPKGTVVKVIRENGNRPEQRHIKEAIKAQYGLDLPESTCNLQYFDWKKL